MKSAEVLGWVKLPVLVPALRFDPPLRQQKLINSRANYMPPFMPGCMTTVILGASAAPISG